MPNTAIRLICLALGFVPASVLAAWDPAQSCDAAARSAAIDSGVPLDVLRAITRVETGRNVGGALRPWPWTINRAGAGFWFSTMAEAVSAAETALAAADGNLDIGCFQLNHRWHGGNFISLDAMFDPETNASYAAAFLADLHRETGDWPAAIAAYHSRNAGPAKAYLARVEAVLGTLGAAEPAPRRADGGLLLQAGGQGSGGSLVPRLSARAPLIGVAP